MASTLSYHITRGEYWQRLLVPKDKRTHWPAPCTVASAFLQDVNGNTLTVPVTVMWDGSVLLILDGPTTASLLQTTYYIEVSGNPAYPVYSPSGVTQAVNPRTQVFARGTVQVTGIDYTTYIGTNNNTAGPTLSQAANTLDLEWVEGDAVALAFTATSVNWSGTYLAQIRTSRNPTSTLMGALTVVATFDGTNTLFTLSMSQANSALIPAGVYYWDLQQVGGTTRLQGAVTVDYQVTA